MPRRVPALTQNSVEAKESLVKPLSDKILPAPVYLLIGKRQTEADSKIYISPRSPRSRIVLDAGGHGTATIRENRWLPLHQWEFNETLPGRNRKQKLSLTKRLSLILPFAFREKKKGVSQWSDPS